MTNSSDTLQIIQTSLMVRLTKTDYLGGLIRVFQKEGNQHKQYRLFWRWWLVHNDEISKLYKKEEER